MSTLLTKGLGYDEPTILRKDVTTNIIGNLIVEARIYGIVALVGGAPVGSETGKIAMFIRDDRTLSLTVHQENGTPVNITSAKMWFTVKNRLTDIDSVAVIQKKYSVAGGSDADIRFTEPVNGKAEIYIVPDDTDEVDPGIYVFDIQVTLANGKTYTIARDKITFKEDVTKTRT